VLSSQSFGNHGFKSNLKRLLFVDDEPNIRATLPTILRRYGFTVAVAGTVSQALDQIKNHEFGLLLCDLNIEREGDGYIVIRAMRAKNPDCVTMILTGYPALESAVEGIHVGIDGYLMKPTNANELVALLAEKLAKRESKGRVLTVSHDEPLLKTWALLLQSRGYEVDSLNPLNAIIDNSKQPGFDVLILDSSVPTVEKRRMIDTFRHSCDSPVIAVPSIGDDQEVDGADYHVEPDPELLLECIADVISKKSAARNGAA